MSLVRTITVVSGTMAGSRYVLKERLLIGRGSDCDLQLDAEGASRKHALLMTREDGVTVLRDLASANGTLVEGEPVRARPLVDGEVFVIDGVELRYGEREAEPSKDGGRPGEVVENTTHRYAVDGDYRAELVELARELSKKKR